MGLINLLTDLTSFQYYASKGYPGDGSKTGMKSIPQGHDRRGGGSSNQPYITTPIPEKLGEFGYLNQDFILRGGSKAATDSALDVVRLGKYFTDIRNPSGLLFVVKQNLLSRMAVRTQASTGLLNEGVYTPLSTLAEAGGVAFGLHVNKQGLNPFGGINTYSDTIRLATNESVFESHDRLSVLYGYKILNDESTLSFLNGIKVNLGGTNILSYQGGPGSFLGIGNTNIKFADQRTQYTDNETNPLSINGNNVLTYTNQQLGDIKNVPSQPITTVDRNGQILDTSGAESFVIQNGSTTVVQDFRAALRGRSTSTQKDLGIAPLAPDYLTKNIEQRVNLGNPGDKNGKNLNNYSTGSLEPGSLFGAASVSSYDKITALPLYQSDAVNPSQDINDLIQFRIQVMSNSSDNKNTFIHFRAFLDSISDSYEASWDATKYLGRGENFYTYNGFNRKVSLSWTVAAQSKAELIPMYKKLNYLASTLAPDYSPDGYMRGNLVKLTVGGYFYEQPGFITGLSFDISEDTSWEIGIDPTGGRDKSVSEVPHIIRVKGFSFTPIHEFVPRKVQSINNTKERFISLGYGPGEENNYKNNSNIPNRSTLFTGPDFSQIQPNNLS